MSVSESRAIDALQLALATFLYTSTSHYDEDLLRLREACGPAPDFTRRVVVRHLLTWLRKWKCRNFELRHQEISATSIAKWYAQDRESLKSLPNNLLSLTETAISNAAVIFDRLANARATPRKRVGPTAASKILYIMKPYTLPPWDEPIRAALGHRGDGESYANYLRDCVRIASDLSQQCQCAGTTVEDIVSHGRSGLVGIAKALDEYYWTTITNKVLLPNAAELHMWSKLSASRTG